MSADEAVEVTACRGCGGRLTRVLDLGRQPACDHFPAADDPGPDPRWPLGLTMCESCTLVQLDHTSPAPEEPLAVESDTLQRHALGVSSRLVDRLGLASGATFREYASHHGGSWAPALSGAGLAAVGGEADVVVDNQSIIHAEDLEEELAARVAAMGEDGVLVIEFHHALRQLLDGQFDTVRHGHPLYFSLHSWVAACARHGLTVVDAWTEDVFGGCLVVVARRTAAQPSTGVEEILAAERGAGATSPEGYRGLSTRAAAATSGLAEFLRCEVASGHTVAAYGAGSKAVTFLGVAGIGADLLPMVADLSPGKQGRRIPGVGMVIVSPAELVAASPDVVVILTWDIAAEVVTQLQRLGLTDARFIVPLPELRELGGA